MSKTKRRVEKPSRQRERSEDMQSRGRASDQFSLSGVGAYKEAERKRQLPNLAAFAGYMLAVWLIVQSANNPPSEPTFGFRWSPAILGLVVAMATALVRNERDLRSRLRVFDADRVSRLVYSVAWSALALIAMAAVMTIPRY